jgi:SAM-dependent methyltransferase
VGSRSSEQDAPALRQPGRLQPLKGELYTSAYYESVGDGSLESARQVVPLVSRYYEPSSVADVGCGTGAWLSIFQERGVTDVYGLDGPWVQRDKLKIPEASFQVADLSQSIRMDRVFDLAVCLEVAEHLPESSAVLLIESLTHLAPLILFSAAIPGQGGVEHINEQWPSYWADLFRHFEFVPVDCLRRHLWDNPAVEFWYAQNIMYYVRGSTLADFPNLAAEPRGTPLALVHPKCFLEDRAEELICLKKAVAEQEGIITAQRQHIRDLQDCKAGVISPKKVILALPSLLSYSLKKKLTPGDPA